jgi:hypothetical protein
LELETIEVNFVFGIHVIENVEKYGREKTY